MSRVTECRFPMFCHMWDSPFDDVLSHVQIFCHTFKMFCHTLKLFCHTFKLYCHTLKTICHTSQIFCHTFQIFCHTFQMFCHTWQMFCHSLIISSGPDSVPPGGPLTVPQGGQSEFNGESTQNSVRYSEEEAYEQR